jgi:hypothetical protein
MAGILPRQQKDLWARIHEAIYLFQSGYGLLFGESFSHCPGRLRIMLLHPETLLCNCPVFGGKVTLTNGEHYMLPNPKAKTPKPDKLIWAFY